MYTPLCSDVYELQSNKRDANLHQFNLLCKAGVISVYYVVKSKKLRPE